MQRHDQALLEDATARCERFLVCFAKNVGGESRTRNCVPSDRHP
jgi:hypothetical protein